jgi:hypothetical protein
LTAAFGRMRVACATNRPSGSAIRGGDNAKENNDAFRRHVPLTITADGTDDGSRRFYGRGIRALQPQFGFEVKGTGHIWRRVWPVPGGLPSPLRLTTIGVVA